MSLSELKFFIDAFFLRHPKRKLLMLRTVIISSASFRYMLRFKLFESDRKSADANLVLIGKN